MTVYDIPENGSVRLGPGDRARWSRTNYNGKTVSTYTPKDLHEVLTSDGHVPGVIEFDLGRYWPSATVPCSCGQQISLSLTRTGRLNRGALTIWSGHKVSLAAPHLVWESTSARTRYKCYVAPIHSAPSLLHKHDADRLAAWASNWAVRFLVVTTSESKKSGKIITRKWENSFISYDEAVLYAKRRGLTAKMKGQEVTWDEAVPVTKPSGEAAAVLAAIHRANAVSDLVEAVKLADEYLNYADLIREAKEAAVQRFHGLVEIPD